MATISADIYFDGIDGDDAWDGSAPNFVSGTTGPKKSIAYMQNSNNHIVNPGVTIWLAEGSEWNVTEEIGSENRLQYRGNGTAADPITVAKYTPARGVGPNPLLHNYIDTQVSDWTDIGGGDWTYTTTISSVSNGAFIRYALLKGSAPYTDSSFITSDLFSVSGVTLTVSSGANDPVTTYNGLRLCYLPVFFQFCDINSTRGGRVYRDIDCSYAGSFVSCHNTTALSPSENNEIFDCNISWCGKGIVFKNLNSAASTSSFIAYRNYVKYISHAGITCQGPKVINSLIENNDVHWCNLASGGNGNITLSGFGNTVTPNRNKAIGNRVSYGIQGRGVDVFDGAGIYVETGQIGSKVEANIITYCHHAIQDNSGEQVEISGNFINNCDIGIVQTDSVARGNVDASYTDNCFKGMTYTALEYDPAITAPLTAIVSIVSNGTFKIVNNVMQGATGTVDDGLRINTGAVQTIDERANHYDVGGDDIVNTTGTPQSIDATSSTGTVILSDNGIGDKDSVLIGNGVNHWTGPNPDTTAEPKSSFDTDIGLQSTFGPFHPKNL